MIAQWPLIALATFLGAAAVLGALASWRFGVLLLLAALPFTDFLALGTLASGMKALTVVVAGSVLIRVIRFPELYRRLVTNLGADLSACVIALIVLSFASMSWAESRDAALQRTVSYIGVFTLMQIVALLDERHLRLAWLTLLWSAAVSVPIGFLVAGNYSDVFDAGRFTSGGLNPNDYAGLLLISGFVTAAGVAWRRLQPLKGALLLVVFAGILMSGSRTSLVAIMLAPAAWLVLVPSSGKARAWTVLIGTYIAIAVIAAAFQFGASEQVSTVRERALSIGEYRDDRTWAGRLDIWLGGAEMIADHAPLGVGSGNFAVRSPEYSIVAKSIDDVRPGGGVAHNIFLGLTAELGLAGIATFLLLLYRAFRRSQALYGVNSLGPGLLLGLVGYLFMGMTLTWEHAKIGYVLFGAILAAGASTRRLPT